jgi:hypothetical protein
MFKKMLYAAIALMVCVTTACSNDVKKSDTPKVTTVIVGSGVEVDEAVNTATLSIDCSILADYDIELDNYELFTGVEEFEDGAVVFDILEKVCNENDIEIEYSGEGDTLFITSLGGYDDKTITTSAGWAGWIFKVNDESAMESCGSLKLKTGDVVEFIYTDGTFF